MHGVKAKQVLGYMVMPAIVPRVRNLFASGFGYLAFLMASIYSSVRLLPPNHPYLIPTNIGKFGIRHVIAEAANNLVVKKENTDQVIIFGALLTGIVILLVQFVMLIWSMAIEPAIASGTFVSIFITPTPKDDIAFMLLDRVFGIPKLFDSCVAQNVVCPNSTTPPGPFPWPFHLALHRLFQFYSLGILIIGVLIFLYLLVVVIAETAVTGSPFGQRFQSVWTPVRLIVAIGLLVPINYGYNSGQYITLYAAKFGSSMATNAWQRFNKTIQSSGTGLIATKANPMGEAATLIAMPKVQDASTVTEFMSIIHACAYAYYVSASDKNNNKFSTRPKTDDYLDAGQKFFIQPYFVKHSYSWYKNQKTSQLVTPTTSYADALDFYDNGDIIIRWGEKSSEYKNHKGNVKPFCGDVRVRIGDLKDLKQGATVGGADAMQEFYFDLVKDQWFAEPEFSHFAVRMIEDNMNTGPESALRRCGKISPWPDEGCGNPNLPSCGPVKTADCARIKVDAKWKQNISAQKQIIMDVNTRNAWRKYATVGADIAMTNQILDRGWGGAGIWYNRIAQLNGGWITGVLNAPTIEKYPLVMEQVRLANRKKNASLDALADMFNPNLKGEIATEIEGGDKALERAKALYAVFKYWHTDGASGADDEKEVSGNIFEDAMNMLFGTYGLLNIRQENIHTHPLAALTAVGKGLVESAIRNMATASASAFLGGMLGAMGEHKVAGVTNAVAGFFSAITFTGLTAGFVLFYILPFLPFVYFFFAVGSWVKSIFEAMVGVPLWALAHLRLDGNGLPGESAQNGYFLFFEIFVRPILTVFGLVAAITIFAAQVRVLNLIWDLVLNNLTGYQDTPNYYNVAGNLSFKRAIIDQFFFTVIYTIICYMLATASFKLIDKIPDNILRWMGAGVSSFSDINDDPVDGLTRYAALGGMTVGQQLTSGITTAVRGGGQLTGQLAKEAGKVGNLGKILSEGLEAPPKPPTT